MKTVNRSSSIHAIQRVRQGVIDESLPYDTDNPYGEYDHSKAEATRVVQEAADRSQHAVIVCPTGVIGPYDFLGSMTGDVIRTAAEQKPTLYIDGAYDFVDVRDVAQGLIAAAKKGHSGESYILSGEKMTVPHLLETIREITGRHFFRMKIPFTLAKFVTRFPPIYYRLSWVTPRFIPYSLEVLRSNSNISHAKVTSELGYHPRPLYESIPDTIRWFLESKQLKFSEIAIR